MSIAAKEVLHLVRFKQQDHNEIKFSDYDIKNALNEALRYIVQSQALQNSDFLDAVKYYSEEEINKEIAAANEDLPEDEQQPLISFKKDGVELPEDYQVVSGVTRAFDGYPHYPIDVTNVPNPKQYKVLGGKIYAGVPAFYLTYKKSIGSIKDFNEDVIDLPAFCLDLIIKVTGMILNQAENDILLKTIDSTANAIIPRRKYNNARMRMPFYC